MGGGPEQNADRGKGISWKGGKSMATLLGSDVGALWSQGLEGSSVSKGRDMRNEEALEGVMKVCICILLFYAYLLGFDVGP